MDKRYQTIGNDRIACVDRGNGAPVLFLHGLPTSSYLWRYVIERLENSFRCIAPDLMGLGDTEAGEKADLSMPSQARMVTGLMDALGIESAAIVTHDQGGAVAQIMAVGYPERVASLVLVDVVCYDNWPVSGVKLMRLVARFPIVGTWAFGSAGLRSLLNRFGAGFPGGFYDKSKATPDIKSEYIRTVTSTRERVRRFKRFLLAGNNLHTTEIAPGLKKLSVPALIVWGENDPYISLEWAKRLAADIPGAKGPEVIRECGHFVPWEKPSELADLILGFVGP